MKQPRPAFGALLREYRETAGLNQTAVAQQLGLGQGAISKWETGETMPRPEFLPALARILGTRLDVLLFGYDDGYDSVTAAATPLAKPRSGGRSAHDQTRALESAVAERDRYKAALEKMPPLLAELTRITASAVAREDRTALRRTAGRSRRR